jgi:hypothetical protein
MDEAEKLNYHLLSRLNPDAQSYAKAWNEYVRGRASMPSDHSVYGLSDREAQAIRIKLAQLV